MSVEELAKKKYGEDLADAGDVEELILDSIGTIPELTAADKAYLEKFTQAATVSMQHLGLKSLANMPTLPDLFCVSGTVAIPPCRSTSATI